MGAKSGNTSVKVGLCHAINAMIPMPLVKVKGLSL